MMNVLYAKDGQAHAVKVDGEDTIYVSKELHATLAQLGEEIPPEYASIALSGAVIHESHVLPFDIEEKEAHHDK